MAHGGGNLLWKVFPNPGGSSMGGETGPGPVVTSFDGLDPGFDYRISSAGMEVYGKVGHGALCVGGVGTKNGRGCC